MDLELHTSAPSVELANDAARNARCKECDHMLVVYMNTPGIKLRYACKELGFRLCVDICDEVCPKMSQALTQGYMHELAEEVSSK